MLIALFTYLFMGFLGDDNFIQKTRDFADTQTLERKQLLNQYADELQVQQDNYREISKGISATVHSPEASREDVKALLAKTDKERERDVQKVFNLRFKVKDELSREEWQEAYR